MCVCVYVLSHIRILSICIWAAHKCTGNPYVYGLSMHVWAVPYRYHNKPLLRPYESMSAHTSIGISDHKHTAS